MRTMKTLVAAAAVAATLTIAVPAAAAARQTETRTTASQRGETRAIDRAARAVKRFIGRVGGGIGSNNWPIPPIPAPAPGSNP